MNPTGVLDDAWDDDWTLGPPWYPRSAAVDEPDMALIAALDELLNGLEGRRADVLRRRLGMSGHGLPTLQDIGDDFGLTRERIRQIQAFALRILRTHIGRASLNFQIRPAQSGARGGVRTHMTRRSGGLSSADSCRAVLPRVGQSL